MTQMTTPRCDPCDDRDSNDQGDLPDLAALSRDQQQLYNTLRGYSEELGALYLGGLRVLHDAANPDRMAQSAHSMRELMVKMGELEPAAVAGSQGAGSMKPKVFQLKDGFGRLKRNTVGYSAEIGVWTGPFNGHLHRFLTEVDDFFAWVDANRQTRRAQFQRTMVRLDASDRALPQPLLNTRYREWQVLLRFFQGTSHHGLSPSHDEVREKIGELEAFLAKVLVPTTSDDLNAIDALLQESDDA